MQKQCKLPDSSIIRIFPSEKILDTSVQQQIVSRLQDFLAQWKAHGAALTADAFILHNRFVVVAIDDKAELPSGCSIDSLFRYVGVLEKELGIDLNSRSTIYILKEEGVIALPFGKVSEYSLSDTDRIFNLLCPTLGALGTDFLQSPRQSAYARLFSL